MRLKPALMLAVVASATGSAALAADFSALAPSGQTIYFNLDNQGGAVITYPGASHTTGWNAADATRPTGALVLPDSVTHQGQRIPVHAVGYGAFYNCPGITSVSIMGKIATVDTLAFFQCTGLTEVTLGTGMATLCPSAFGLCNNITTVVVRSATPPAAATSSFSTTVRGQATLRVGCGLSTLYGQTAPWSTFSAISEEACAVMFDIAPNYPHRGSCTGSGEHAMGEAVQLVATPAAGCLFACWNDGDTLNPRPVVANTALTLRALFFPLQHDTVALAVHDTLYRYDTVVLRDTLYRHDTLIRHETLIVHDTLIRHDTVALVSHDTLRITPPYVTLGVQSANPLQGVAAGSTTAPEGTAIEVAAIPAEGYRFSHWSDGNTDNPRQVVLMQNTNIIAHFAQALGIGSATTGVAARIAVSGRAVDVSTGADVMVSIYDLDGRLLHRAVGSTTFEAPAAGVYMVRAGTGSARRVVVN